MLQWKNIFSWVGGYCQVWDLILLYLQSKKLACYCFMGSGWRHKTLIRNTELHYSWHSKEYEYLHIYTGSPVPKSHQREPTCSDRFGFDAHSGFASQLKYTDLEESTGFLTNSKQAYSLSGEIPLPLLSEEIESLIIS